ncbi:hypothetical protein N0V88_003094 [Collariella sp. IMI 366227]|nr:hypothetical protein N0V88_003094 [Collariella sp. IMI 366227]
MSQVTAVDPRVSELLLRSLRIPERTTSSSKNDNDNELEMYLPILLDCPIRTSAWEASTPVRQLAYALLQHSQRNRIPFVAEMRRLQSVSSGLRIDVPRRAEVDKLATSLLALLTKIECTVRRPELVWVVLAVYQDIVMSVDRGRGVPLSIETLRQDAEGKLDACSWPFIHLFAQVQATIYSLRMLRQILDYTASHHKPLSHTMSDLQRYLSRLPPLADFPSPRNFPDTVRSISSRTLA